MADAGEDLALADHSEDLAWAGPGRRGGPGVFPRPGSAYLLTLGACLLVSVLAMGALWVVRIEEQRAGMSGAALQARIYARAGLDMALYRIRHDPTWRADAALWTADRPIGGGFYSFTMTDPVDGNLTNSIYDPVVIVATGKCGSARQKLRVRLNARMPGFDCLKSSVHAGGDVVLKGITATTDHWMTANGKITVASDGGYNSVINSDLAAPGGVSKDAASVINGQKTTDGKWPMTMPDPATVFDYYKSHGTWISIGDLPRWNAELLVNPGMEGPAPLSPTTGWSPYGACTLWASMVQKAGVYSLRVQDCQSQGCGPSQDVTAKIASGVTYVTSIFIYPIWFNDNARITLRVQSTDSGTQTFSTPWTWAVAGSWKTLAGELTPTWTGQLTSATFLVETQFTNTDFRIDGNVGAGGAGTVFYKKPPKSEWAAYSTIHRKLLSPNSNPFGTGVTNPEGIYVIDCGGATIDIRRSRIVGTLVVLNGAVNVSGAVHWAPAVSNYPALLSNNNVNFWLGNQGAAKTTLREDECNVNYNPPGTPYGGQEDSVKDDVYDALVRGIVYATGKIVLQYHPVMEGVVVAGGNVESTATVDPATGTTGRTYFDVTYLNRYYDDAPPGFGIAPAYPVAPGTFSQAVD